MRLRIATCRPLPEPDVDEGLLLEALQAAGVDARMAAWHESAEWRDPLPTVIRSTWDYIHHPQAFGHWLRAVAATAPLWNPLDVVLGNLHKHYLIELAERGVPVTPTVLLERGKHADLRTLCVGRGWGDVVVKPAVGAGSHETHRLDPAADEAAQLASRLLATQDLLVQPYLASVDGYGERAMVWIDGEFTHAVRKSPRFAGGVESVSESVPISTEERALGEAALASMANTDMLYARVDVAPGADGKPVVMELELVEPSLFLLQHPPALQRLVRGIVRRLR
jgi:glutathione synthase/RimK-type ligase-like ATP-grasp enzyme